MAEPNFDNRTLFHGDNLGFLRGINSESIDLVATDPPFNKGKDFHATPDSLGCTGEPRGYPQTQPVWHYPTNDLGEYFP